MTKLKQIEAIHKNYNDMLERISHKVKALDEKFHGNLSAILAHKENGAYCDDEYGVEIEYYNCFRETCNFFSPLHYKLDESARITFSKTEHGVPMQGITFDVGTLEDNINKAYSYFITLGETL